LWRASTPEAKEEFNKRMGDRTWNKGRKRPDAAERMRANNPMSNSHTVAKMRQKKIGCTFLSRGGNGMLTQPQIMVAAALDAPTEYAIPTLTVRDQFKSLPTAYKVDVALPDCKLAIEIDGNSHNSKLWRFLDARKTEVLAALGWRVLRFTNARVLADLDDVLAEIRAATEQGPTAR
jgi:hypothetical protein